MIYKLKDYTTESTIEFESSGDGNVLIKADSQEGDSVYIDIDKDQLFTLIGALHTIQKHNKNGK